MVTSEYEIKALANEYRVKIIIALSKAEMCVCHLEKLINIPLAELSKHMFMLKSAGLIKSRNDGKWEYYSLNSDLKGSASDIIGWLKNYIPKDPAFKIDMSELDEFLQNISQEQCK